MDNQVINELGLLKNADNSTNSNLSKDINNLATLIKTALAQKANSSDLNNVKNNLSSLKDFVHKYVKTPPVNIFPNYWVKQTSYGPHKDAPTFHVPVQQGKQYTLSFMIADGTDNSNLAIRAASSWNVADEWGDIVENDGGASGNKAMYHITFTAPQSGNMPINFMFCRQASAMSAGINVIMIQRITMTQTDNYVPYQQCDNSKQSLADVTGDAGMDAKAMFGNL